jgi:hypothetical protein
MAILTPEQVSNLQYWTVDKMSGDEYRANLSNPEFAKKVDELIAAQPKRPSRA